MSVINERPRDCFSCKLVGSVGLIGSGLYILYYAKKTPKTQRFIMSVPAAALISLGITRYFDLPPFEKPPFKSEIGPNFTYKSSKY